MAVEPVAIEEPAVAAPAAAAAVSRGTMAVLCGVSFLAVVNFSAPRPFFSEMASDLETTVPLLGQVGTAMTLLSAAAGLAIGPLADRYGHRRLLVLGVVAVGLGMIGMGLAPAYWFLLATSVTGGLGDAILFGIPLAIAGSAFVGEARRRAISLVSAALPCGTILGVPLIAAVGDVVGWRAVFVGTGALITLGAAGVIAWVPADARRPADALRVRTLPGTYRPLLGHRPTLRLYAVSGLRGVCWIGAVTYLGAFLAETYDLSEGAVGIAYFAGGLGFFLGSLAAAGRLGRLPVRPAVAATIAAQGVLLGLVFALEPGVAASLALLPIASFAGAIGFVGIANLLATVTPIGAATTMVLNGSVLNVGAAVGSLLGGLLIALGGYPALGIGLPLFAVAAGLMALERDRPAAP